MNENTIANARATADAIAEQVAAGRDPEAVIHAMCQGDGRFWVRQALCVNATPAH